MPASRGASWSHKRFWPQVPAMAGAAGHGRAGAVHHGNVVAVDIFNHLVHEPRSRFLWPRIVGEVERRLAIGTDLLGVGGVAGAAMGTQRRLPGLHDLVDLIAGKSLGQHFEIGGGRMRALVLFMRRGSLRGLRRNSNS